MHPRTSPLNPALPLSHHPPPRSHPPSPASLEQKNFKESSRTVALSGGGGDDDFPLGTLGSVWRQFGLSQQGRCQQPGVGRDERGGGLLNTLQSTGQPPTTYAAAASRAEPPRVLPETQSMLGTRDFRPRPDLANPGSQAFLVLLLRGLRRPISFPSGPPAFSCGFSPMSQLQ